MNNLPPPYDDSQLSPAELAALYQALTETGRLLPTTEESFGIFAAYVDRNDIQVPVELRAMADPSIERLSRSLGVTNPSPLPIPTSAQNLAQAARDGGKITDDVRQRMINDKLNAKRQQP